MRPGLSALALAVSLILGLGLAVMATQPSAPQGRNAPADQVSAARAMQTVRAIATRPHPTGSAENDRVRLELIQRLQGLGLEVSLQTAPVLYSPEPGRAAGAWVRNIVAVLPGRDRSRPAVLVMSHYDSVPGSPGAADDAAGVAATLEAVRALQASGQDRERDLVVLITDAEEQGLLGARAFFETHPLRSRIGAVVNLEARGSSGRPILFETGPDNGAMVSLYARAVDRPSTTSAAVLLYRLLPNDTDFTLPREAGIAGLNLAFIGRPFHYHAASATPEGLDIRSLQDMSDQSLGILSALVAAPALPEPAPDAVFADILGLGIVVMPAWGGWILLGVVALGLLVLMARVGPERVRPMDAARSALHALGLVVLAAALARLARLSIAIPEGYVESRPLQALAEGFETGLGLIALGLILMAPVIAGQARLRRFVLPLLAILVAVACQVLRTPDLIGGGLGVAAAAILAVSLQKPLPTAAHAPGALLAVLLIAAGLQAFAPEATPLWLWPMVPAVLAALAVRLVKGPVGLVIGALLASVAIGLILVSAHLVFVGLGVDLPFVGAVLVLPFAAAVLALVEGLVRSRPAWLVIAGLVALVGGAGLVGALNLQRPTPERPGLSHVMLLSEPAAGRHLRLSLLDPPDAWSLAQLGEPDAVSVQPLPELFVDRAHVAEAEPVAASLPPIGLERLSDGRIALRILPGPEVRELRLSLNSPGPLSDVMVNGTAMEPPPAGEPLRLRWAAPQTGVTVLFRPPPDAEVEAVQALISDLWPRDATPLPDRPATVMPWSGSDAHVRVSRLTIPASAMALPAADRPPPP